jgi:signal peptidase I
MITRKTPSTPQPQLDLAIEILRSGSAVRLKALGSSMLPALWPDDVLTIEPVAATAARPGEIVLCIRDGGFVIHRLVLEQAEEWTTRGDAMPVCDPPFQANEVLGRVVKIERGWHVLKPKPQDFLGRMAGWMVCHFNFCQRLALRVHSLRQDFWLESQALNEADQIARVRAIW